MRVGEACKKGFFGVGSEKNSNFFKDLPGLSVDRVVNRLKFIVFPLNTLSVPRLPT